MKIPLEKEPFPPVRLTPAQEQQLHSLSDALLEQTLAENDDFVHKQSRVLDKTNWKQVMSRENLHIYKRVGKGDLGGNTPHVDLYEPHSGLGSRYWRLPVCIGVGTLAGSLDDLLYGQLALTSTDFLVRTTYTKDDGADTRVLATLTRPTQSDPLHFLLVRWVLLRQFVHNLGVAPRDVIFLDSNGTKILPDGTRMGYIINHSVEPPGCGALSHLGLVRAAYSACYVFRDTGHGSIEVYMRAYMESGGKLSDGVAVFSASMALISIWRSMLAGQNKKLAYISRTKLASHVLPDVFDVTKADNLKMCPLCLRNLSSFRSSSRCGLCLQSLCSRCVDKRKLTHVQPNGSLVRVPTFMCKSCMSMAAKMNARDVAASEQEPDSGRTIRFYSNDTSSSGGSQPRRSPNFMAWLSRDSSYRRQSTDTISSENTAPTFPADYHDDEYGSVMSSVSFTDTDFSLPSPSFDRMSSLSLRTVNPDDEANVAVDESTFNMWTRMNQLRVADDETFMLTQKNSATWSAENAVAEKAPANKSL